MCTCDGNERGVTLALAEMDIVAFPSRFVVCEGDVSVRGVEYEGSAVIDGAALFSGRIARE